MLLELWQRVASRSEQTGMDAAALAEAVAPCMAWEVPLQHATAQVATRFTSSEPSRHSSSADFAHSGVRAQVLGPT